MQQAAQLWIEDSFPGRRSVCCHITDEGAYFRKVSDTMGSQGSVPV